MGLARGQARGFKIFKAKSVGSLGLAWGQAQGIERLKRFESFEYFNSLVQPRAGLRELNDLKDLQDKISIF